MKYIICGDLHLGSHGAKPTWHNSARSLIIDICEYAKKEGIDNFIGLGDFFDNRNSINLKTLEFAMDIADMLNETFDLSAIIIGNHDTYFKTSLDPTSLTIFRNYKNIIIVDKPMTIFKNFCLLPWLFSKEDLEQYEGEYLIGHFEMNGVKLNTSGTLSENFRYNFSDFKKFTRVLSGHFHTPGTYGNVTYVGSPYHLTFNDSGPRGYYILDTDNDSLKFIEFTDYPKYVTMKHNDDYASDKIEDMIKDNIIRLVFTEDVGTIESQRIIDAVKSYNPHQLFTLFQIEKLFTEDKKSEVDIDCLKDNKKIYMDYLNKSETPVNIKKPVLKQMVEKLYEEIR